jgi:hypothetical protein
VATSIPSPTAAIEPGGPIDFGEIPVMTSTVRTVMLSNHGAQALQVSSVQIAGDNSFTLTFPPTTTTASIAALAKVPLTISLNAMVPAQLDATLQVTSNDPHSPLSVPIHAVVTQPQITVTPLSIAWGSVPQGWAKSNPLEIRNDGFGKLIVSNIDFIAGSSNLFTIQQMPTLPVMLDHGQRLGFELQFRAETQAPFTATLGIDSNDPVNSHIEVTLTATGASCMAGCPVPNATPSCAGGNCTIGMCNMGWYDLNMDPSDGCECNGTNASSPFCDNGVYLGTMVDTNHDRNTVTSVLPTTDSSIYRVFGEQNSGVVFGNDYDFQVTLSTTDPTLRICVYRHETGSHLTSCFFDSENCPSSNHYEYTGDLFHNDSADYIVKVMRTPNSPATCTPFTLFFSIDG